MMQAAVYQHQMSRHGRAGEPVGRFHRVEAPAAHKAQDTRRLVRRVGSLHGSDPRLHAGFIVVPPFTRPGLRARPLSRGWCVALNDLATFRARIAAGLTPEQAVALDDRPLMGAQTLCIEAALSQPEVEPPHQFRALSFDASDEKQASEGFDGTVLYQSGEFPKASGDHQHEFC